MYRAGSAAGEATRRVRLKTSDRLARLLGQLIFGSLLALLVLAAIPYGSAEPWWVGVVEGSIFSLAALWVFEVSLCGRVRGQGRALLLPLTCLVGLALVQLLPWPGISYDPYETWLFVLKFGSLTLYLALLSSHLTSRRRGRALTSALILIGCASAVFGLLRAYANAEFALLPALGPGVGYAQFANRNHFALLMEMTWGVALGAAVANVSRRRSLALIYVVVALVLLAALVLSNSRGGIVGMLGQFFLLALIFNRFSAQREPARGAAPRRATRVWVERILIVSCLLLAVGFGVIWLGGESLVSSLDEIPSEFGDQTHLRRNTSRIEIWDATWHLIEDQPIAGVGLGGYWVAISRYHDASGAFTPQQAHNDYLELVACGGVVSAVLGLWFVVSLVRRAVRHSESADRTWRISCLGALTGLMGVAAHSLFDFGLHITINALVLMSLVAFIAADPPESVPDSSTSLRDRFDGAGR
jgi:O-antigen ligase